MGFAGVSKLMVFAPDFLIIGAARAGTTALHAYLRQHPDIFMPATKEMNYFAYVGETLAVKGPGADFINNAVTDAKGYAAFFRDAPQSSVTGEASPLYLFEPAAPENIARLAPNAKLIAILRDPVEQAYSHFMYATKSLVENEPDFAKALELEDERLAKGWQPLFGYSRFPRYGEQLARYLERFSSDQILLLDYADYQTEPLLVLQQIMEFVGVTSDFEPDMSWRPNAGGVPKNQRFQDFLLKPNPVTGLAAKLLPKTAINRIRDGLVSLNLERKGSAVPEAAKAILVERLSDDVTRLEELTGRNYDHWRKAWGK